jgi:DNA-binding NarL/FixJ family response regulator
MIKLLLADDQPLFRESLAALLDLEDDLIIVGQANNGQEAIDQASQLQPDIILMDLRMPICNGIEATKAICDRYPWIRILVLTTFDEDDDIWRALQAGALGYLLKNTPAPQLASAIRTLHQGHSQLGPTIAPKVFAQINAQINPSRPPEPEPILPTQPLITEPLSDRERQVLQLIRQGHSNREIAKTLHLSEGTVRNHVSQILSKLQVRDRTQAALWAAQHLPDSL